MTRNFLHMMRDARPWSRLSRRHFLWPAAIGVGLAAGYNAALPLLISTADVRPTVEHMLDAWSGGKSRIASDPEISFWPEPTLTLRAATIETADGTSRKLAHIGRITASFSLLSAFTGTPKLKDMQLIEPVVTLQRQTDGTLNWQRPHWLSVPGSSIDDDDDTPFGDVTVENGRLQIIDLVTNRTQEFSGISGTIKWPNFSDHLSAQLSGSLGGQLVNWTLDCNEPLTLLAGRNAALKTSLTSTPLNLSFEGTGNISQTPIVTGRLQISTVSLQALATWYQGTADPTLPDKSFSLGANVTSNDASLKLDELQMTLGDATATGILDIASPPNGVPRLEGTLAFDHIDLNGLQPLIEQLSSERDEIIQRVSDAFARSVRADIRLSAQEAVVGPVRLSDLAAGVIIDHGRASIDIADSTYANGRLSGRISVSEAGLANGGKLELVLKNADLASALSGLGFSGPVPNGRGNVNFDLTTAHPFWAKQAADASGRIRLSLANGSLFGFDPKAFADLVRAGEFFSLAQASDGSFAFQTADIEATFEQGSARLNRALFTGQSGNLSVNGVIPYRTGSLALAGTYTDALNADQRLRFFVGGSWPNAVISPLSVLGEPN
ncbi:MAG TPA: AsmA family protein [Ensifer sp.]|jgi:AsmA protein|uniref:AsmA family protein n=1 Tax=Ensifer sp. TaxID=1872086 RepID=UPI002E0D1413|nr:AsmA family protein [Ensifer sp.]